MSQNKNNPYAQATSAYDTNAQVNAESQREVEARVLLKSNRMLQQLIDGWDERPADLLEEVLKYNRQIWMLFYDTAIENKEGERPNSLRSNIINLANFIFKREIDVLATPKKEKLEVLISINREISAGLMTNPEGDKIPAQPERQNDDNILPTSRTDISG